LTPKKHMFEHDVKLDIETRVRQGVKAVLEEVLPGAHHDGMDHEPKLLNEAVL
jgi:hypothetical protein